MEFNYIEDAYLKQQAGVLLHEANSAIKSKSWNAVGALSGATLEIVFLAVFEQLGESPTNIDGLSLTQLIKKLKDDYSVEIPDHIFSTAFAIKDYRNLFHPGKSRHVGLIGKEEALAVYSQLIVVLKWLEEWGVQRFRLTASEIANSYATQPKINTSKIINCSKQMSIKQWNCLLPALENKLKQKEKVFKTHGGSLGPMIENLKTAIYILKTSKE